MSSIGRTSRTSSGLEDRKEFSPSPSPHPAPSALIPGQKGSWEEQLSRGRVHPDGIRPRVEPPRSMLSRQEQMHRLKGEIRSALLRHRDPYEEVRNYQDLHLEHENTEEACSISELIKEKEQSIFIQGEPGTGKSELCKYIRRRWQEQKLWSQEVDYLFLIPIRELSTTEITHFFLVDILYEFLIKDRSRSIEIYPKDLVRNALLNILTEEKTLIVFDGYDERQLSQNKEHYIEKFLQEVLKRSFPHKSDPDNSENASPDEFPLHAHLIVTSRPLPIREFSVDTKLINKGFSEQEKRAYILHNAQLQQFPRIKRPLLKAVGNENHVLFSESRNPFVLKLLCHYVIQENIQEDSDQWSRITLVDLYIRTLLNLSNPMTYHILAEIAYEKLTGHSSLLFSREEIEKRFSEKGVALDYESLTQDERGLSIFRRTEEGGQFAFSHLTLQEFLAAAFLADHFEQEKKEVANHCKDERYCKVWIFLSGLFKEKGQVGKFLELFQILTEHQREIFGQKKDEILLSCIDECPINRQEVHAYLQKVMEDKHLVLALGKKLFFFNKKNVSKMCGKYMGRKIQENPDRARIAIWGNMEIDLSILRKMYRKYRDHETRMGLLDVALQGYRAWEKSENFTKCEEILEFIRENYKALPHFPEALEIRKKYFTAILHLSSVIFRNKRDLDFFLRECKVYADLSTEVLALVPPEGLAIASQLQKAAVDAVNGIVRCAEIWEDIGKILKANAIDLFALGSALLTRNRRESPSPTLQVELIEWIAQDYRLTHRNEIIGWFFEELKGRYLEREVKKKIIKSLVQLFSQENCEVFLESMILYLTYANERSSRRNRVRWGNFSDLWKDMCLSHEVILYSSPRKVAQLAHLMRESDNASLQRIAIDLFCHLFEGSVELEETLRTFFACSSPVKQIAAEKLGLLINALPIRQKSDWCQTIKGKLQRREEDCISYLYLSKFIHWGDANILYYEILNLAINESSSQEQLELVIDIGSLRFREVFGQQDFPQWFFDRILEIAMNKGYINTVKKLFFELGRHIDYFDFLPNGFLSIALDQQLPFLARECAVKSLAHALPLKLLEDRESGLGNLIPAVFGANNPSFCSALMHTLGKWIEMSALSEDVSSRINEQWEAFMTHWAEFVGEDYFTFSQSSFHSALLLDFFSLQSQALLKGYCEFDFYEEESWERRSLQTRQSAITAFAVQQMASYTKSKRRVDDMIDFFLENLSPELGDLGYKEMVIQLGGLVSSLRNKDVHEDFYVLDDQVEKLQMILARLLPDFQEIFFDSLHFSDHCGVFVKVYESLQRQGDCVVAEKLARYIIGKGQRAFLSVDVDNVKGRYSLQILNQELFFEDRENAVAFREVLTNYSSERAHSTHPSVQS